MCPHANCHRGNGIRRSVLAAIAGTLLLTLAAPGFAQSACTNDVPVVFRDGSSDSVTLKAASVRNVTGSNNDDRSVRINGRGPLPSTARGGKLVVDSFDTDLFPASAVRNGFNRNVGRFWEVNFPRDMYVFDRRSDLDVEVKISVSGEQSSALVDPSSSVATFQARQRDINTAWWGGSNSLRRLRGTVRFRYSDLHGLAQAGTHRAKVNVCIEVRGHV